MTTAWNCDPSHVRNRARSVLCGPDPCVSLLATIVLLLCASSQAQRFDPLRPPNTYRNADSPHYWRNRPPYWGYWQQDVHYTLNGKLDEVHDHLDGEGILVYWNRSPDRC